MTDATEQSTPPEPSPDDIHQYRDAVQVLFALRSREEITNSIPAHAAVLIEQFFAHAESSVRIFCRTLASEVYDREFVVHGLKEALSRGVDIEIILQEPPPRATSFTHLLTSRGGRLFRTTHAMAASAKLNFAVMDTSAVRVERDHDHCEAVACMNSAIGDDLLDIFNSVKSLGVEPLHV